MEVKLHVFYTLALDGGELSALHSRHFTTGEIAPDTLCVNFSAGLDKQYQRLDSFLFVTSSRPALGSIWPPFQWVPREKQTECEANHSPPFSTEVNTWRYTSTPPVSSWCVV